MPLTGQTFHRSKQQTARQSPTDTQRPSATRKTGSPKNTVSTVIQTTTGHDLPKYRITTALSKTLASPEFRSTPQLRAFLDFVVHAVLDDRHDEIKGYTIAVEALGRDQDFNPVTDPIVRVEAARLRRRLVKYYTGSGKTEPVYITVPKGGYAPAFEISENPGSVKTDRPADQGQKFFGRSMETLSISSPLTSSESSISSDEPGVESQISPGFIVSWTRSILESSMPLRRVFALCVICLIAGYFFGSL